MCQQDGVDGGYRELGPIEFTRLKARALTAFGALYKEAADLAYRDAGRRFAEVGTLGWLLEPNQWRSFEKDTPGALARFRPEPRGGRARFAARLVSNTHDCVGGIFIKQYLESLGGSVQWVHFSKFKSDKLGGENLLFTIIIGGPKSPGSRIASAFYQADRPGYLRMYSGLHFESSCLKLEENGTHCYWLGGVSKIHTLRAAYMFTIDPEVAQVIEAAVPRP